MKKLLNLGFVLCMMFVLAACSTTTNNNDNNGTTTTPITTTTQAPTTTTQAPITTPEADGNDNNQTPSTTTTTTTNTTNEPVIDNDEISSLVVYFSATGNTEDVANTIASIQNVDTYEIVPEQLYTSEDLNYNDRSTRATREQNDRNARPAISGSLENLADYDVIYIGYPIWWGDMPRIMYTFFDSYDFSGKTIAPFCTSGGSGLSGTPSDIQSLEPNASVLNGLHVSDSTSSNATSSVNSWLSSIGLN